VDELRQLLALASRCGESPIPKKASLADEDPKLYSRKRAHAHGNIRSFARPIDPNDCPSLEAPFIAASTGITSISRFVRYVLPRPSKAITKRWAAASRMYRGSTWTLPASQCWEGREGPLL